MKRIASPRRAWAELWRGQEGATAVLFALLASTLIGMAGFSVDIGRVMTAKSGFNAAAQSAALAGAYALAQNNSTATSVSTAVTNWTGAHAPSNVAVTNTTTQLSCVTTNSNLPGCSTAYPNVVTVTQTGTVTTFFLKAFGYSSFTLKAVGKAAKAGGTNLPMNVMFVLDATANMNAVDLGCYIPNLFYILPTRFQCALYSVQSVLRIKQPPMVAVGVMAFPGSASQFTPSVATCGGWWSPQPSTVPYLSSSIYYQIGTGLDTNYNVASQNYPTQGGLNRSDTIVVGVGDYSGWPWWEQNCFNVIGNQGTYIAEVLTKAQAALPVVAGTKNIIILVTDGNSAATAAQLNNQTSKVAKQCGQYVTAAQAATSAGTTVYTVAYGSPTSGCSSGDTYNPCTAMQAAASDPTKFYSTGGTCTSSISSNNASNLPTLLTQIVSTWTKPRPL